MKFNKAKRFCDGCVAYTPSNKAIPNTFVKRKGHTNIGQNKVWAKLISHIQGPHVLKLGRAYTANLILELVGRGYRVKAVNFTPVED